MSDEVPDPQGTPTGPCSCDDYQPFHEWVLNVVTQTMLHPFMPKYRGVYFRYCPFCGRELEEMKSDERPEPERPQIPKPEWRINQVRKQVRAGQAAGRERDAESGEREATKESG